MTSSIPHRVTIAAALALLAVVAGGILVLRSGEPSDAGTDAAARQQARGSDVRSTAQPRVAADERATAPAAQRTDAFAEEWNDATRDVVGPIVEGTIVVTDREGRKHEAQDGSFVPDFIDGVDSDSEPDGSATSNAPGPWRRPVAVKGGRIRFDARGATAMLVDELELGGHAALVDGGVDLETDQPLEIEARWIDDVLLHVVDATTRRELSGVRVCFGGRFVPLAEHPGVPGPPSVLFNVERSPVHLTRATPIDRVVMDGAIWVGARDRAWKRESIDFEREQEHEVALGPAGALVVVVTEPLDAPPFDRRAPPRVRLRHPGHDAGEPICDLAAEPGEFELDGLEPGEVVAAVEIGDSRISPVVLSRAATSIRADAIARVTLSLDPALVPKLTTLAGTAYVPPAWGATAMQIDLEAIVQRGGMRDDYHCETSISLKALDGRPGWHEWSIRRILPGTYRLLVRRAGFETPVEVGADGRDDVTLTLQEPAVLLVRVVDETTRVDVDVGDLHWFSGDRGYPFPTELTRDRAANRWVGAVPPGHGRVLGANLASESSKNEFTVLAGINELLLRSPPPCGVILSVDGLEETRYPGFVTWSAAGTGDSRPLGHRRVDLLNGDPRIILPGPGTYRFEVRSGADRSKRLVFDVAVPKGEFVEKSITLDR